MTIKKYKAHVLTAFVNICSFLVAAIFIFSGFTKAVDPVGGGIKIGEYLYAFGLNVMNNDGLLGSISILQSTIEFMVGIYLLLGMRRKLTSLLLLVIMMFMTLLTFYIAKTNAVSNCGCFGDAVSLNNWDTFYKNVVILAMSLVIAFNPMKIRKALRMKSEWMAKVYSFSVIIVVSLYSYHYLPIIDFRPFYIGQNIIKGMEIPEDAKPPVYETVFTLRKGNEVKKFTLENYPDSTWQFVDSDTKLIEKGYEPEINNFALFDSETEEEVTTTVLNDKNFSFWLVMPYIEKADNGVIDAVEDIYDYCKLYGYNIYGMTSSGREQIQEWKHNAGIDFPFCQADDITLKTIIRSNPGLLLLHGGNIINKWSKNNLPDDEILTARIEKLTSIYGTKENGIKGAFKYLCYFLIPLIFLIFADKYRAGRKSLKKPNKIS